MASDGFVFGIATWWWMNGGVFLLCFWKTEGSRNRVRHVRLGMYPRVPKGSTGAGMVTIGKPADSEEPEGGRRRGGVVL